MIRSILILLLILSAQFARSQSAVLHLDKPYYTTGEIAWFKLYLPEAYATLDAKIEVQITDNKGVMADSYYLDANGQGVVDGYWNVPYTLETGVYSFSFVVNESRQQKSSTFASFNIDIYNDLNRLDPTATQVSKAGIAPSMDKGSQLKIKTSKNTYQPREDVQVEVMLTDATGNPLSGECSVSISNMDMIGKSEVVKAIKVSSQDKLPTWIPSDKLVFNGLVTDTAANPTRINVFGLYSDQTKYMYLGKSNEEGEYTVATGDFYGKLPAQAIGYVLNEIEQIDINDTRNGKMAEGMVGISDDIEQYIAASRLNKKIRQYYKTPPSYEINQIKNEELERKPNADYDFNDYEPFDNAGSFFNETNTSRLKFSTKDGRLEAVMFNPKGAKRNFKFPNPPTFIVDGKVTRDANLVGRMPFEDVATAELYFLSKNIKSTFGTNGGSGYVILNTQKGDFSLRQEESDDMVTISGLQRPADFTGLTEVKESNAPRFQPVVYWDADVKVTNGVARLLIPQTDDVSTFLITIVGKTQNGDLVSKALTYQVNLSK